VGGVRVLRIQAVHLIGGADDDGVGAAGGRLRVGAEAQDVIVELEGCTYGHPLHALAVGDELGLPEQRDGGHFFGVQLTDLLIQRGALVWVGFSSSLLQQAVHLLIAIVHAVIG